jgi:pantoate--beta-alanine ligase
MTMPKPQFTAGDLNVYSSPRDVSDVSRAVRATGRRVMLVPTMGALHEGHLSLIRAAKRVQGAVVVVSIFVNPLQFGAGEDLDAYPRTLDDDLAAMRAEGVEVAFTPTAADMYPDGRRTSVHPGPLGAELEGAARPTHFAGVLTVVLKLLQIVRPDRAFFGEKDYQQLVLVRQMVADLNVDTQIVGVPIVREADGLAMSSPASRRARCRRRCWQACMPPPEVPQRRWTRPAPCSMKCPPSTSTTWRCGTRCWDRRLPRASPAW